MLSGGLVKLKALPLTNLASNLALHANGFALTGM
jgi:hypothetical protein